MAAATVLFCTTDLPLSALLRWAGRSPASHVALGYVDDGLAMVAQADFGGVTTEPRTRFLDRHRRLVAEYAVAADVPLHSVAADFGLGYDYAGLFGYAAVVLARWLRVKARNPLASARRRVCSEFVAAALAAAVPACAAIDPEATTPGDLWALCAAHPDCFRPLALG